MPNSFAPPASITAPFNELLEGILCGVLEPSKPERPALCGAGDVMGVAYAGPPLAETGVLAPLRKGIENIALPLAAAGEYTLPRVAKE